MDFEPVLGWYGGTTGALTQVHVEVVADAAAQVTQYESGVFSLIGYGRQGLPPAAATRYTTRRQAEGPARRSCPLGLTFWVGFNLKTGPFAGIDAGRAGRHAFSHGDRPHGAGRCGVQPGHRPASRRPAA